MKAKPKNNVELQKMRDAGQLAARVLDHITPYVEPGVSTLKLNDICHEFMVKHNATPATLGYRGFPKSCCISINDVVCHGIPSADEIIQEGDILNIDVTAILNGYHGDTSRMYLAGEVSQKARELVEQTYLAMMDGIHTIKSGSKLSDIGRAIQDRANTHKYGVVRDYCGHGLGRKFHEEPAVLHYAYSSPLHDMKLRKGLTFTVEPMINLGTWECETMHDDWTVRTLDRKLSAQFEHSVGVTENGVEIFTKSLEGLHKPPYK